MEPASMATRPPALIEAIAARLIPPDSREHVLGDLHERYTTPGRYARDVVSLAPRLVVRRVWRILKAEYGLYCAEFAGVVAFVASHQRARLLIPSATIVLVLMLRDAYVDVTEWPGTAEGRGDAFASALTGSLRDQLLAIAAMWLAQLAVVPPAYRTATDVLLNLSGYSLLMLGAIRVGWWALYVPGTRRSRFHPARQAAGRSLSPISLRVVRVLGFLAIGAGLAPALTPPHVYVRLLFNVSAIMALADIGQRAQQRVEERVD
jgi:hypothetical protein